MSAEANAASRQGMLFGDPLEGIETDEVGYRGPIACSAAGITYRQLDYWARTGAGYRKYSAADVARLRYVLAEQRDSFTPLSVIRSQLDALDAGHTPSRRRVAQMVSSEGQTVSLGGRRAIPASDLADLTGVDIDALDRYSRLGLITPDMAGYFPARCVQAVSAIARLECAGVDVRVLRAVRQGAERSADIIDQTVSSQRGRGRGADRERARARAVELGELFAELHRDLLTVAISALSDEGV